MSQTSKPMVSALVVAVLVTLFGVALAVEPAGAQEPEQAVLVVLDVSGSMDREGDDGTVLLDAARTAVTDFVADIPAGIPVGLRLYGHQGVGGAAACEDTELVLPVGAADLDELASVLDPLEPSGDTPIGPALQEAAGDLAGFDQATVVLVSDGEADCVPPDPCEVAEGLSAEGIEVVVDTVGLLLAEDEAEQQLSCIAEATGGTYVTADDAPSLATALQESATRAQRRYEVTGESIAGSAVPFDAPDLQPGVTYVDEIRGDESLFYGVGELGAGDTFDVEVVREGVQGRDGYQFLYSYLVDRDNDGLGHTTCCSGEDLDTVHITAMRDIQLDEDVEQAFVRIDSEYSRVDDPGLLSRVQLRVVPTGASATPSPTSTPDPTPTASPTPSSSPSSTPFAPTATPSAAPDDTETVAAQPTADGGVPGWLLAVIGVMGLALVGMAAWIVRLQRQSAVATHDASTPPPPPSTT